MRHNADYAARSANTDGDALPVSIAVAVGVMQRSAAVRVILRYVVVRAQSPVSAHGGRDAQPELLARTGTGEVRVMRSCQRAGAQLLRPGSANIAHVRSRCAQTRGWTPSVFDQSAVMNEAARMAVAAGALLAARSDEGAGD
jgi:hypothetical protein